MQGLVSGVNADKYTLSSQRCIRFTLKLNSTTNTQIDLGFSNKFNATAYAGIDNLLGWRYSQISNTWSSININTLYVPFAISLSSIAGFTQIT
jgi:hypothetical protein